MKKILPLILISLFLIVGCGSDDSNDTIGTLPLTESFNLMAESESIPISSWQALRTFDNFDILGETDDNRTFYIRFNANGVLDRADYVADPSSFGFSSSYSNPSETFTIQNVSVDEVNKIVNISFEGIVYENDTDVFSPSSTIEITQGQINVKFEENPAALSPDLDTFIDAKIDGVLFESMKHAVSTTSSSDLISFSGDSDGIASININYEKSNISVGTFQFSPSMVSPSVSFTTFDPFTDEFGEYIEYETSGTLIIEVYTPSSPTSFGLLKGTFQCTASSNGQTINITEGKFNFTFI